MNEKPTFRDWLGMERELDFSKHRWLAGFIAFVLGLVMIAGLIIAGALILRLLGTLVGFPILGQTDTDAAIRNLGLAVVAIFSAPFLAWRTMIAQNQANTAEQGHITDRINTAVQGLGAEKTVKRDGEESTEPNLEVRIGAIYALERIAQDSDRDHIQIMEILCAYIRQNTHTTTHYQRYQASNDPSKNFDIQYDWEIHDDEPPKPRVDIQTVIDVIGRRSPHQISIERNTPYHGSGTGYRIDLRQVDLFGANMAGLDFCHALFDESNLSYTDLSLTKLDGASLHHGLLNKSGMLGSLFKKLRLDFTELYATQFKGAAFIDTNLVVSKISDEQINSAFGDASVALPENIPRPDHWATEKLELHEFITQWRDWQKSIGFTPPENKP